MFTDTHCHLNLKPFDNDRDTVIQRAVNSGVGRMLVPGLDLESSRSAVKLAEMHEVVHAAVGFHPTDIDKMNSERFNEVCSLAKHPKVAAIGEIGLDYYWIKAGDNNNISLPLIVIALRVRKRIDNRWIPALRI